MWYGDKRLQCGNWDILIISSSPVKELLYFSTFLIHLLKYFHWAMKKNWKVSSCALVPPFWLQYLDFEKIGKGITGSVHRDKERKIHRQRQLQSTSFKLHIFTWYYHGWETAGCSRHAGQSNFPRIVCRPIRLAWKKLCGFVTKKAQETCFVSPWKAIFPMDSPLSQHKKRSLPSDIRYFSFALVNCSVTLTLTYFRPRWNSAANQRAQHCAGKGRRQWIQRLTSYNSALIRHCGWLTCMEIIIFIAEVTTVYHGPLDCVSWLLCLSRRYKVFQANILMYL